MKSSGCLQNIFGSARIMNCYGRILCRECLESIASDVLYLTDNDHGFENADPLERAEIWRRWRPFIGQLPQFSYLCDEILPLKD